MRRPAAWQYQSKAERASLDKHKDFLDSLDLDAPKGCWSILVDDAFNVVTLRSLLILDSFSITFWDRRPTAGCTLETQSAITISLSC